MSTRALALLLAVPLTLVGAAGVALHLCQSMGGMVVGACDCERSAGHDAHGEHQAHAQHRVRQALEAQPCCAIEFSEVEAFVGPTERSEARANRAPTSIVGSVGTPSTRAEPSTPVILCFANGRLRTLRALPSSSNTASS